MGWIGMDRNTVVAGIGLIIAATVFFLFQGDTLLPAETTPTYQYDTNNSEQALGQAVAQQGLVAERQLPDEIERNGTYTVSIFLVADRGYDTVTVTEDVSPVLVDGEPPLTFSRSMPQRGVVYNVSYTIEIPSNTSGIPTPRFDGSVTAGGQTFQIGGDTRFG